MHLSSMDTYDRETRSPQPSTKMTSREIADLTGKQHSTIMRSIRAIEPAWKKVNGLNFELVEYIDNHNMTSILSSVTLQVTSTGL